MTWLVWTGAAVSLTGVAALIVCVGLAMRARRAGLDDAALRARLRGIVALNMAALAISAIGLMTVILGIALG